MINKFTISAQELSQVIGQKEWIILDCRFDLKNSEWGFQDYQLGHIPGALYADMDRDYSKPATVETGRHPLPDSAAFCKSISDWGITPQKSVVVYDTVNGAFAARLWWMLTNIGYTQVCVLDGGFSNWFNSGFPVEKGINVGEPSQLILLEYNQDQIFTTQQIVQVVNNLESGYKLIDARSLERYCGDFEPIDPVAGHIPGAINRFHQDNLTDQGFFKTPEKLREEYLALVKDTPPEKLIVYCGSGVTSCHNILSMEIAGLHSTKLYLGSWSEWIRDPIRPIQVGNNP